QEGLVNATKVSRERSHSPVPLSCPDLGKAAMTVHPHAHPPVSRARPAAPRRTTRFMIAIAATLALLGAWVFTAVGAQAATDYTQGVTPVDATQAKFWFKPTTPAALVDVHYLVNGAGQQN